jgi:hypothetical protein
MKKNNKKIIANNSFTEFLLYTTPNGQVKVEIFLRDENIWLTQDKIALLFGVQRPAITKHLKNIFESGELDEKVVSSILEHTTIHGAIAGKTQNQSIKFYNLDAILSIGYRVNSAQATQFRIWATERLKEYIIKGFTMDDERLKQGGGVERSVVCWADDAFLFKWTSSALFAKLALVIYVKVNRIKI